jgi:ubiquitin carboxyl-terminal hydrolase 5/13
VFSYAPDEEDMVLDPNLASHLADWGINMMQVQCCVFYVVFVFN